MKIDKEAKKIARNILRQWCKDNHLVIEPAAAANLVGKISVELDRLYKFNFELIEALRYADRQLKKTGAANGSMAPVDSLNRNT